MTVHTSSHCYMWQSGRMATLLAIVLALCVQAASAQDGVVAAGDTYRSSSSTASVSIGLPAFEYETSSDVSLSQGIQQVFEDSTTSVSEEELSRRSAITAYPNPCSASLNVTAPPTVSAEYFRLSTIAGAVLKQGRLHGLIDMQDVSSGVYCLSVVNTWGKIEASTIIVVSR